MPDITAESASREAPPARAPGLWRRGAPAALLVLYLAQCAWFMRTQSLTYDEPVHIAEGQDGWRNGRFEQYNDHPPLARLWCALPLLDAKWQIEVHRLETGFEIPRIAPDPQSLAWRARAMNVLLGLALGCLLWRAAAQTMGGRAATGALALFAFCPALIANFSVATTDGAAALTIFLVAWSTARWRSIPTWRRTCLLGVAAGLMLLSKFSTVPMFAVALACVLMAREGWELNPARWNWKKAAAVTALALLTLWAGYFFHVARLRIANGRLTASFPHWQETIDKPVKWQGSLSLPVPAGEYIEGFRTLLRHNRHGQASYFLGKVSSTGGWKLYYPVVILLKWPTIVLVLGLAALWRAARGKLRMPREVRLMGLFPAVYLAFAVFSKFNLGERHILPLYPFALLLAGCLWRQFEGRKGLTAALAGLALLNVADAGRFAPGYLSYFAAPVTASERYRLLSDSNLDWGQGLLAEREYERSHPGEKIWLAYFGSVDPGVYGVEAGKLGEDERREGLVIVSATNLSGQFLARPDAYRWVKAYPNVAILDESLYVFRVTPPASPVTREAGR